MNATPFRRHSLASLLVLPVLLACAACESKPQTPVPEADAAYTPAAKPAETEAPAEPVVSPRVAPEMDEEPADDAARRRPSNDESYVVVYVPDPDPIPMNELFALDVWVFEKDGTQPAKGIELAVDAAMPEHAHGMNTQPRVEQSEPGRYRVDGLLFHMPGYWEIYCDIAREGTTERAQFEVTLE